MSEPSTDNLEAIQRQILDFIGAELVAADVEVSPTDDLLSRYRD